MSRVVLSPFTKKVLEKIRAIPAGKVATYKQIAELAGHPGASRGVAWILHSCSTQYRLPWHRVINARGRIAFDRLSHNFREQKRRLEKEGVELDKEGQLDLEDFQWKPRAPRGKKRGPRMFSNSKPN